MRKKLYVDGVDLSTYGVYVTGTGTYGAPERKIEITDIPNRNGAILGIDKSYSNINVSYPCFIYASLESNIEALRSFLLSRSGYVKIRDDYHTDEYRMGIYNGPFNPTIQKRGDAGSFTLTFNCMPQRFLDSGETAITGLKDGGTFTNPTPFPSKPLIHFIELYSGGTFELNGVTIGINLNNLDIVNVTLDCETMDCFDTDDGTSYNDKVTTTDFLFPEVIAGENTFTTISASWGYPADVTITPRWWTL